MRPMLCLALMVALVTNGAAGLRAQAQNQGARTPAAADGKGVISGTVRSSSGRPLSDITVQLVDMRGVAVGSTVVARDGDFTLPAVVFGTYTLECIHQNKVIDTSKVVLKTATESVKMTCTSDAIAWWKKPAVIGGLAGAAVAIGATAVVAGEGDASGSR